MELFVKPEILMSYIYGPTFGNAESHLFLFAAQCFNTEPVQIVFLWLTTLIFENRAVYKIMWKNMTESDTPHMTIQRMRTACCITKVTDTHSEYVMLVKFSSVKMVTRTRLVTCLVLYYNNNYLQYFFKSNNKINPLYTAEFEGEG
jgi:hypothetical protein